MVQGKTTSRMRKELYWIGSSILASTANSMSVCDLMSAPIGKNAVGDESLESVDKLSEGYLSCIDSIFSKGVRRIGRGATRESSARRMMEEAIGVWSIDERLGVGRIDELWRRYLDRLLVLTRNRSWNCLQRERSRSGQKRSRIGGRKQIRMTTIGAIWVYATISTKNRAVVVIKVLMTTPIAPMGTRVGSLDTNLGSTRTAQTVKINSSYQLSIIHSRILDEE